MDTKKMYMQLAIQMAEATLGQTSPNPVVGCVVVNQGMIVGMGAHMKAGEGHAERIALEQAGEKADGADLFVTLEPCAHFGKTPPCADLIISKKIRAVYIASIDPNPLVAGQGVTKLREAGIIVETGICEKEAARLNRYFFHYMNTKRPYVTLKTAMTLDGKTATSTKDSKWITSEAARLDVHQYRHRHDAILAGIQTIHHDNPLLTTRLPQGGKNAIRIVLDTHLNISLQTNVIKDRSAPTIIVCGQQADHQKQYAIEACGATVKRMSTPTIEIEALLDWLGTKQIMSLFVEGGSTVHGAFLDQSLYQEIVMYIAPKMINDRDGVSAFGGRPKQWMAESHDVEITSTELVGQDLKLTCIPKQNGAE